MWKTRVRRIVTAWKSRPTERRAYVTRCRCAGACKCAGMVPYLLYRELELETEFYRGVM